MKLYFQDLDQSFPIKGTPSLSCTRDGVTVNSFSVTIEGGIGLAEDEQLTGNFAWQADDGFSLRDMAVEAFDHYDLHENKTTAPVTYHEDEEGNMVPDDPDPDFVPEVLSTSLYFTTSPRPEPVEPPEIIPPDPAVVLANAKAQQRPGVISMRDRCIEAGIQVQTEYGVESFPLTERDKTMLLAIYAMVQGGMTQFPYHSLGASDTTNMCVVYSDADIGKIAVAAFSFITFHESYANMLAQWIDRAETPEEVYGITYGVDLPEDLQQYLEMIMASAATGTTQEEILATLPVNMPFKGSDIILPVTPNSGNIVGYDESGNPIYG